MPDTVKNILKGVVAAAIAAALCTAYICGAHQRRELKCTRLNVIITDSTVNRFISSEEVRKTLDKHYGEYIGIAIDSIDLMKIEEMIDNKSAVKKSEVYATMDGTLNIRITQRKPMIRFQTDDRGFYADEDGILLPLQTTYTSHVHVVDGNIPIRSNSGYKGAPQSEEERIWLKGISDMIRYMDKGIWKDKIVQIHIDRKGDIILIPREGKARFIFGQPVQIAEKFRKMEHYYSSIVPEKGEKHYSCINLKFKDQIVCR